jgi:hypothetical protein
MGELAQYRRYQIQLFVLTRFPQEFTPLQIAQGTGLKVADLDAGEHMAVLEARQTMVRKGQRWSGRYLAAGGDYCNPPV